jgi:signal peptidase II
MTENKKTKNIITSLLFLFVIAGIAAILDQWTKGLVRENLATGERWMPWEWLATYARILHWQNEGAAFGFFQGWGSFIIILSFVVIGMIIYYFPQIPKKDWGFRLALSLQMGGAIGNLIDRLKFGEVTDFVSVGNFPLFNVADSCISVGAALMILTFAIQEIQERKQKKEESIKME